MILKQIHKISVIGMLAVVIGIIAVGPAMADDDDEDENINMDMFMEDFTRHDEVITEITNSQCSLGEVVTGFGPNGEFLCSPDNTGEDTLSNFISRTETIELASEERKTADYFCEPGEIMLGGIIETPSLDTPITSSGEIISDTEQSYKVTFLNRNSETVPVNVTYFCYDVI